MTKYDLNRLSVDEKIGQLLVFGFDALDVNDHAIRMIKDHKAGNVILFARNIKSPAQLFQLTKNLQRLAQETIGIPLLISIDQEGGMVTRIKQGTTIFPGAMTLAATNDPKNSFKSGQLMGRVLKSLGINMNLAPSLDINNNPHNPVIGVRSFGDTPAIVTRFGIENIRGLQEHVIATAKHFPGHGDTSVDSHLDLPTIDKSLQEIEDFELKPFKAAIDAGVLAIMSSHINFPAVNEDGLPATLSKQCLTGLLREKLGFEGLIVTDCMQMKAIQTYYTTPKGCLMALKAGADMVMVSHDEALQKASLDMIKKALQEGEITEAFIDTHVKRILDLKQAFSYVDTKLAYEDVSAIVEDQESMQFSLDVVQKAMTRVKGEAIDKDLNTLLIASNPVSTTIADEDHGRTSIIAAVNQALPKIDTLPVSIRLEDDDIDAIIKGAKTYEQVVFCSYNANIYQKQLDLIRGLNQVTDLHVIAMRNPYDHFFEKSIKHLCLMYEYTPNAVSVLIQYLKGEIEPQGLCPVTL